MIVNPLAIAFQCQTLGEKLVTRKRKSRVLGGIFLLRCTKKTGRTGATCARSPLAQEAEQAEGDCRCARALGAGGAGRSMAGRTPKARARGGVASSFAHVDLMDAEAVP